MKRIIKIFLASVLALGIYNTTEAQDGRGSRGSSGRGSQMAHVGRSGGSSERSAPSVRSAPSTMRSAPSVRSAPPTMRNAPSVRSAPSVSRNSSPITRNPSNTSTNSVISRNNNIRNSGNNRVNVSRGVVGRPGNSSIRNTRPGSYSRNIGGRSNYYYSTGKNYRRPIYFSRGPRYSIIPRSFISLNFGGHPYYYNNGSYYGYYGGYYRSIFPPFGLRISVLPFGYTSLFFGGIPYYYYNGVYYNSYGNGYQVVDAPMGAQIPVLPQGAQLVVVNGERLYELNGTYYKPDVDINGNPVYTVVGKYGEINNTEDNGQYYDNQYNDNQNINQPYNNSNMQPNAVQTQAPSLQMGDVITQLPEGTRTATINGEKIYVTPDGIYLNEEVNNGVVQYRVVGQ